MQFAAAHNICAGAGFAQHAEQRAIRVGLETVMHTVPDAGERTGQLLIPVAQRSGAIDKRRRPGLPRDCLRGDQLAVQRAVAPREGGRQYALDHTTSYFAGCPVTMHVLGAFGERNSASGITRIVAFVASFTCASTA